MSAIYLSVYLSKFISIFISFISIYLSIYLSILPYVFAKSLPGSRLPSKELQVCFAFPAFACSSIAGCSLTPRAQRPLGAGGAKCFARTPTLTSSMLLTISERGTRLMDCFRDHAHLTCFSRPQLAGQPDTNPFMNHTIPSHDLGLWM